MVSNTIAIAYIPVLHRGYMQFLDVLKRHAAQQLYLIGDELLAAHEKLDYINRKDRLRALDTQDIVHALRQFYEGEIAILDKATAENLRNNVKNILAPAEDITDVLVSIYFPDAIVERQNIFLRWNRNNVGEDKTPLASDVITADTFQKQVLDQVLTEAGESSDWWRQVGAALVKDGEILCVAHNEHMPEKQLPNIIGDSRALFKRGSNINYVTTAHAEATLIAEAARRGISTEGADLYVTDFPCPYCARMLAKSGIKKVYFMNGYALLDGDEFLKGAGIEVVRIQR